MKTINKILEENWYTKEELLTCEREWICNWVWWKWGIQFTDLLRKLKYFNKEKEKELLFHLDLIADIHDIDFNNWWWIKDFIKSNYKFCNNLIKLLNWTNTIWRITIFTFVFTSLNIFWIKYFNWNFKIK